MAVQAPGDDPFTAAFGGPIPMPTPTPAPPVGTSLNNTAQSPAPNAPAPNAFTGAYNDIWSGVNPALIGVHNWLASGQQKPVSKKIMDQVNKPMSFNSGVGFGGTANSNPNAPIAYTPPNLTPQATAQVPTPPPRPPPGPQAAAPPSPAGWAGMPNMNNAMLGDQMMGGGLFGGAAAQQGPPQGALAAPPQGALAAPQQPSSPFTMVLRPNADAAGGGRGGGGPALSTALDLSGWRPSPPPAPPSINLGYGGGGQAPSRAAPPAYRAQPPAPYNPFTHVYRDPVGSRVPVGQPVGHDFSHGWAPFSSGIVQGRGGTELLNPGKPLFGW
jgi:hypothetical protein